MEPGFGALLAASLCALAWRVQVRGFALALLAGLGLLGLAVLSPLMLGLWDRLACGYGCSVSTARSLLGERGVGGDEVIAIGAGQVHHLERQWIGGGAELPVVKLDSL